jgi:hypothetical protein
MELFTKKVVTKLSKYGFGIRDPRAGIRNRFFPVHLSVMHDIAICQVTGRLVVASSDVKGCDKSLLQEERVAGNIVLVERGDCMFIEKGRVLQVSYYLK